MGDITHTVKLAFFNQQAAMFFIRATCIADGVSGQGLIKLVNSEVYLFIVVFNAFQCITGAGVFIYACTLPCVGLDEA
jgi:hypothetical protein